MQLEAHTANELFARAVARAGNGPAIHYLGKTISYAQLDQSSDALAAILRARGVAPGDRIAAYMQNIPQFLTILVAAWKAGAIFLPINPMNRAGELAVILEDAQPAAIIMEPDLHDRNFLALAPEAHRPAIVLTASPAEGIEAPYPAVLGPQPQTRAQGVESMDELIAAWKGTDFVRATPQPQDEAMLVYTSGTTGRPKGAISSHRGVAIGAKVAQDTSGLPDFGTMLAMAPLFHITGLMVNLACTFHAAGAQILSYRFDPETIIWSIERYRPFNTVGAITAYIALMNTPGATKEKFASLQVTTCGGAPLPLGALEKFRERFGLTLRNGYGMTETSGIAVMVPEGADPRVDPESGAVSVGKAVPTFTVTIVDDAGNPVPAGATGEIILGSPGISPGYWQNAQATAESRHEMGIRTGDVGLLDEEGWLFIVDRKKDMIIAGGYKVWPREVEDVLYTHPAVREAAVIGVPDAYRGETVKACVSLREGHQVDGDALQAFCKERLAAYKYPRIVEIMDDLPKTETGKVLRRFLRDGV
ncbi:MAG: class I adenylate-forming enzyme family protein [Sphingobium sp.]